MGYTYIQLFVCHICKYERYRNKSYNLPSGIARMHRVKNMWGIDDGMGLSAPLVVQYDVHGGIWLERDGAAGGARLLLARAVYLDMFDDAEVFGLPYDDAAGLP